MPPQIQKLKEEKCEHGVVKEFCFNCKFQEVHGMKVEMFNNHHYVRLKDVNKSLSLSYHQGRKDLADEVGERIGEENGNFICKKGHKNVAQCIMQECEIEDVKDKLKRIRQILSDIKEKE